MVASMYRPPKYQNFTRYLPEFSLKIPEFSDSKYQNFTRYLNRKIPEIPEHIIQMVFNQISTEIRDGSRP